VGDECEETGESGTVKCHLSFITKFHFTSVASFIRRCFPETWLTRLNLPEIALAWRTFMARLSEFYLAHKIVMDVSFHIEFGIFIPHTATKANQAP
jgi:hypothetical protein